MSNLAPRWRRLEHSVHRQRLESAVFRERLESVVHLAFASDFCPSGGRVLEVYTDAPCLVDYLQNRGHRPRLYLGVGVPPGSTHQTPLGPGGGLGSQITKWTFPTRWLSAGSSKPSAIQSQGPFDLIAFTCEPQHLKAFSALVGLRALSRSRTVLYLSLRCGNGDGLDGEAILDRLRTEGDWRICLWDPPTLLAVPGSVR